MNTKLSKCGPQNRWLAPVVFAFVAGCFSSPTPKLDRLICATDQQCPVGYTCRVKGQPGGCCKDGDLSCGGAGSDAGKADVSPVDLRGISDTQADNGSADGNLPGDGARDQATGGTGGSGDGAAAGGAGGSADASVGSAADGSGGGTASDGAAGSAGGTASGGSGGGASGNGGSGGARLDAAPDVPPDVPAGDAPGTCGADQDCPSQSPLCLGYRCARCTADSDCAGRSGTPACLTSSGLCVGCTANSHCTASVTTCDTSAHQCVGCVKRSDCPGVCQTCTNSVCTAAKSQDDTLCAGTCDSIGACKSKQGQTCQTVAAGCAAGTFCSPEGYCCDKACTGSCEACDITPGTCTILASGTPHKNHTACITSSTTVCDGKCTGASNACSYPTATTVCGSESCATAGYQGTGTCGGGSCTMPDVVTCPNACVVGTGCTGICKPGQTQCKTTGISQKCNANGTWDDTTCASGNTCSNGACTCSSPNTQCPSVCVNVLGNDAKNCGSCGHDCLGGQCSGGQCQPAVVVSTAATPVVFGVDDTYVYYQVYDATNITMNAYRVSKTATALTSGSLLNAGSSFYTYVGVIGTTLLMDQVDESYRCTFPSSGGTCASSVALPGSGTGFYLIPFKSPSPQYFAMYEATSSTWTASPFNWYTTSSNTPVYTFGDIPGGATSWGYPSQYAFGNTLYWSRYLQDAGGTTTSAALWSASTTSLTPKRLTADTISDVYTIIDANAQSLLLTGPNTRALYRVALPNGDAANPPSLLSQSTSNYPAGATEDTNRIYWFETDGTLYACSPPSCAGKTALVGGQPAAGNDLYQDNSALNAALYWSARPGQVMRLAK